MSYIVHSLKLHVHVEAMHINQKTTSYNILCKLLFFSTLADTNYMHEYTHSCKGVAEGIIVQEAGSQC